MLEQKEREKLEKKAEEEDIKHTKNMLQKPSLYVQYVSKSEPHVNIKQMCS